MICQSRSESPAKRESNIRDEEGNPCTRRSVGASFGQMDSPLARDKFESYLRQVSRAESEEALLSLIQTSRGLALACQRGASDAVRERLCVGREAANVHTDARARET